MRTAEHVPAVAAALKQLQQATLWIASEGMKDPEQAGAAATPYLRSVRPDQPGLDVGAHGGGGQDQAG